MNEDKALRIVVLASGSGTNLQAIIDQTKTGKLPADIAAVVSDNPDAYALNRAEDAGIATHILDFKQFDNKAEFDAQLEALLISLDPELIVLAGYMRVLAATTVNAFLGRMLNVHPSLLPAYPGLHTYKRVLESADTWHGSTVHVVTPELDSGPAIIQYRIKIGPDDTEPDLRARVQTGEYQIYPRAISWVAQGRFEFKDGQVFLDKQPLLSPVMVNESC